MNEIQDFLIMSRELLIYLLIVNVLGFVLMWADKRRAQKNEWRIKERTLLTVALIGGSIGSLIGMNLFRHKTKHPSFRYGIPFMLFLQLLIYIAYRMDLFIALYDYLKISITEALKS